MNPSDTELGRAWLGNFTEEEQAPARLLLDGLDLVGQDRLRTDLTREIERLATTLPTPIALVPVRELGLGQSYFATSTRDAKPALLNAGSFPGSEALIANIATGLRRGDANEGPFVGAPSLRNMRDARCRTVLFVDDFSGSGDRILHFDRSFRRHPTIRSWLNLKWIQLHVVVFAATEGARTRLAAHFREDRVHIHRMCPTFATRPWTPSERATVEALCSKYYLPTVKAGPYGYKGSRGLMAFLHSVPNNLPPLLWQRGRRRGPWRSFFRNQAVPSDLNSLFGDASPEQRADETLQRLRQRRLAEGEWRLAAGGETTRILLVLAALARRPTRIDQIMSLTGLAFSEVKIVLAACRKWGLVGSTLRLTDDGLRELVYAKRLTLRDAIPLLHGSDEPYYPRSLRVGR
jgi:hypothetical protein